MDIEEVYGYCDDFNKALRYSTYNRKLLWRRKPEVKEVTIQQIEEKFGCRVKIVNKDEEYDF